MSVAMLSIGSHRRWVSSTYFVAITVLAAFIIIGAQGILAFVQTNPWNAPLDPDVTTDQFLGILSLTHPGVRVEQALRSFAKDQALLFVAPAKEPFTMQVYYTIQYLAYPRPVAAVICAEPGNGPSTTVKESAAPAGIAGLIFFEVSPGPRAGGGTAVGAKMHVTPYTGMDPWQSFCP